jgi:hypothetical protein
VPPPPRLALTPLQGCCKVAAAVLCQQLELLQPLAEQSHSNAQAAEPHLAPAASSRPAAARPALTYIANLAGGASRGLHRRGGRDRRRRRGARGASSASVSVPGAVRCSCRAGRLPQRRHRAQGACQQAHALCDLPAVPAGAGVWLEAGGSEAALWLTLVALRPAISNARLAARPAAKEPHSASSHTRTSLSPSSSSATMWTVTGRPRSWRWRWTCRWSWSWSSCGARVGGRAPGGGGGGGGAVCPGRCWTAVARARRLGGVCVRVAPGPPGGLVRRCPQAWRHLRY